MKKNRKYYYVPIVCGRKHCATCQRWRHVSDFYCRHRTPSGAMRDLNGSCKKCQDRAQRERLARSEEARRKRREYQRLYHEGLRRSKGIPARQWGPRSKRVKEQRKHKNERVDSTLFVAWLDRWTRQQEGLRSANSDNETILMSLEDLAQEAGVSARSYRRARTEGRVAIGIIDATLIAAHSDLNLEDLLPPVRAAA